MAEVTSPIPAASGSCCSPQTQSSCCEPTEKDACGGTAAAGGSCGCAAGRLTAPPVLDIRETVREKYAAAARAAADGTATSACCGPIQLTGADEASVFGARGAWVRPARRSAST